MTRLAEGQSLGGSGQISVDLLAYALRKFSHVPLKSGVIGGVGFREKRLGQCLLAKVIGDHGRLDTGAAGVLKSQVAMRIVVCQNILITLKLLHKGNPYEARSQMSFNCTTRRIKRRQVWL